MAGYHIRSQPYCNRAQGLKVLPAQSLAPLSIAPSLDKYFTELAVGAKKQETFSDLLLSRAVNI